VRVKVLRGATWVNLSELGPNGFLDFLQEVSWDEGVETPVAQATVRLVREANGWSLSPLVTTSPLNLVAGSYLPLLAEGREFKVEACVVPLGMAPREADWLLAFHGRIDSVEFADVCTFEGRDLGGGLLQDTYLEVERQYGSDAGVDVEQVMAQLLSDNLLWPGYERWLATHTFGDGAGYPVLPTPGHGTGYWWYGSFPTGTEHTGTTEPAWPLAPSAVVDGGTTWYPGAPYLLETPTSPTWRLGRFVQRGESLMDALSTLATQLGWEVRWKWSEDAGEYRLTFWSPDRSATTPVVTLGPNKYQQLGEVRTTLEDVRNVVEVVYSDSADLDAAGQPKRKTVAVSDSASIATVRRRFMRMAEAATSNIDTSSEATTLANAALADLKDTTLGIQVEVDYRPDLELGDIVAVEGNGVHFTATQQGAVRAIAHSFTAATATTKLTLLGRPSTSVRRWLSMEQRPTTAPASPFTGPAAPTGLSSVATVGGFKVSFSPPTAGAKATAYELHVSTSSGFTPDDSTRRVVGALTEMVVTDLEPGTTYYARVVSRDVKGSRGPASSEEMLTARFVEPRTLQPRISWGNMPLNGDFEARSDTSKPPDAWTLNLTWGTNAQTTTDTYSGEAAILFPNIASLAIMTAQPFTVREGEVWVFSAFYKQSVGSTVSGTLVLTYLDASFGTISAASVSLGSAATANTWTRAVQRVTIPSGARFGEIAFTKSNTYSGALTVDSVDALRAVAWGTWQNLSFSNGWTDANLGVYGNAQYRVNDLGEVELRGVILSPTPAPAANAVAFTLPAGVRPGDWARVFDRPTGAGGLVRLTADTTGNVRCAATAAAADVSLDGIRYFVG
jgi:hypothetical protein